MLWFGNNAFQVSNSFFGSSLSMTPDATKFGESAAEERAARPQGTPAPRLACAVIGAPAFNFAQLGKVVGTSVLLTTPQTSLLPLRDDGKVAVPDWTGFPRVKDELVASTDLLKFENADDYVVPDTLGYNGPKNDNSFIYANMTADFGRAVAMTSDGNTVAVGAPRSNNATLFKGCKAWKCARTFTFEPPVASREWDGGAPLACPAPATPPRLLLLPQPSPSA